MSKTIHQKISSNEIKGIRIQFCKTLSKILYETVFLFPFKTFQQQFNLMSTSMSTFLLFNSRLLLKCSAKHSGQKLIFVLLHIFSTIHHQLILDIIWSSFNDYIFCDNFLYCSWLKSWFWFANWALKDVSARPKYILVPLFALFTTTARYISLA